MTSQGHTASTGKRAYGNREQQTQFSPRDNGQPLSSPRDNPHQQPARQPAAAPRASALSGTRQPGRLRAATSNSILRVRSSTQPKRPARQVACRRTPGRCRARRPSSTGGGQPQPQPPQYGPKNGHDNQPERSAASPAPALSRSAAATCRAASKAATIRASAPTTIDPRYFD